MQQIKGAANCFKACLLPYRYLPLQIQGVFEAQWYAATGFAYDNTKELNATVDIASLPVMELILNSTVRGLDFVLVSLLAYTSLFFSDASIYFVPPFHLKKILVEWWRFGVAIRP